MNTTISPPKKTSYEIIKSSVDRSFEPTKEQIQAINPFFLIRFISNDPSTIYFANAINSFSDVPVNAQYSYIKNCNLNNVSFINFKKKDKEYIKDDIITLCKHFKCNEIVLNDYLTILSKDQVSEILIKYKRKSKKEWKKSIQKN